MPVDRQQKNGEKAAYIPVPRAWFVSFLLRIQTMRRLALLVDFPRICYMRHTGKNTAYFPILSGNENKKQNMEHLKTQKSTGIVDNVRTRYVRYFPISLPKRGSLACDHGPNLETCSCDKTTAAAAEKTASVSVARNRGTTHAIDAAVVAMIAYATAASRFLSQRHPISTLRSKSIFSLSHALKRFA